MSKNMDLRLTDCLSKVNGLGSLKDKSVDMILCDLPYGKTTAPWDNVINPTKLWKEYSRVIKDHGAIVLFGNEPFSSKVRMIGNKYVKYHYDYKWIKRNKTNFPQCHNQPLHQYEDIMVFYKKQPTYNPQMIKGKMHIDGNKHHKENRSFYKSYNFGVYDKCHANHARRRRTNLYYPSNVVYFTTPSSTHRYHPTQKPVKLLNFLIKTYTNKGDTVLDNTMGSGSTGVSCALTGRKFIGMEITKHFFKISQMRISKVMPKTPVLSLPEPKTTLLLPSPNTNKVAKPDKLQSLITKVTFGKMFQIINGKQQTRHKPFKPVVKRHRHHFANKYAKYAYYNHTDYHRQIVHRSYVRKMRNNPRSKYYVGNSNQVA